MATEGITTSLSVGFDATSDDKGVIKLTNDWGFRFGTDYRFRLWPSVGATIVTNYGIIYHISSGHSESGTEYVTFSNSDTASTEYPISSGSAVQAGPGIDSNGELVGVTFTIENGQVKASQPFYGGAIVSYTSTYTIYGWTAGSGGESWWNYQPNKFNYAITILAFYEGATATHNVEFGSVQRDDFNEAYKVTSEYVADHDGQWELPPDFPEKNDYPNDNTEGPDKHAHQVLERTHETMTYRTDGSTFIDRQWVGNEKPYTGSNLSYHPVYKMQKGSNPEGTDFEQAFLDLPWGEIESNLQNDYEDIEIP